MKITWRTVTGTQAEAPLEVDEISSPDTVYLRKDIKRTTIKMESGTIEGYSYQEAELTLEEYEQYKVEMEQLETEAFKTQTANNEAIMEAIAEMYEMLAAIGG